LELLVVVQGVVHAEILLLAVALIYLVEARVLAHVTEVIGRAVGHAILNWRKLRHRLLEAAARVLHALSYALLHARAQWCDLCGHHVLWKHGIRVEHIARLPWWWLY